MTDKPPCGQEPLEARPGLHDSQISAGLKSLTDPPPSTENCGVPGPVSNLRTPSEAAGSTLDAGMRTSIEGALEVVRKHDPGRHGLIHNLCRLAAWLDGHPERDDDIRSYYPGFETVIRTEELERMRARLADQEAQLAAAKPAMALVEHAKKLVREIAA